MKSKTGCGKKKEKTLLLFLTFHLASLSIPHLMHYIYQSLAIVKDTTEQGSFIKEGALDSFLRSLCLD